MKVLGKFKKEPGLWFSEQPKPSFGHTDVLIKVKKVAICGTDVHIYQWDEWAQKTIPAPMTTGHEFVGEVVEVGDLVKGFKKGDRVSGEGHITCGVCRSCRAGQRYLCHDQVGLGVHRPGAFADYVMLPEQNVCKIPDSIPDDIAAVLDPFGNAVHAVLKCSVVGEDVLITGAGPVGLMSVAIAKHVGARNIVITDLNDYRLDLARKMGATRAINPTKQTLASVMQELGMVQGFDVGLEMSGNPQAFSDMLTVMNSGGNIVFLGVPAEPFAIDWHQVVFKNLTIKGIYGREIFETWYRGLSLLQSGLDISPVITHHFAADDFETGFQLMLSGQSGKIVLDW